MLTKKIFIFSFSCSLGQERLPSRLSESSRLSSGKCSTKGQAWISTLSLTTADMFAQKQPNARSSALTWRAGSLTVPPAETRTATRKRKRSVIPSWSAQEWRNQPNRQNQAGSSPGASKIKDHWRKVSSNHHLLQSIWNWRPCKVIRYQPEQWGSLCHGRKRGSRRRRTVQVHFYRTMSREHDVSQCWHWGILVDC